MALSAERTDSRRREGSIRTFDVAADAVIWNGAMVALDSGGDLTQAATATTLTVIGVALENKDNTGGSDGDLACRVWVNGIWLMDNSADADAIANTEVGDVCYAVDDRTVAKTDGGATRSVAGTVDQVTSEGVYVKFG